MIPPFFLKRFDKKNKIILLKHSDTTVMSNKEKPMKKSTGFCTCGLGWELNRMALRR